MNVKVWDWLRKDKTKRLLILVFRSTQQARRPGRDLPVDAPLKPDQAWDRSGRKT